MSFSAEQKLNHIFRLRNFRGTVPENTTPWEIPPEFKQTEFYELVGNKEYHVRTRLNFDHIDDPRELVAFGADHNNGNYPVIHASFGTDGELWLFREYMAKHGRKIPTHIGHWDLSKKEVYDLALTVTNKLVDDVYGLIKQLPRQRFETKQVNKSDSRYDKLQWLAHNPSLPREIKPGQDPDIKQSHFFFNLSGRGYSARIDPGIIDDQAPYKITAFGTNGIAIVEMKISFRPNGEVASLIEDVFYNDNNGGYRQTFTHAPHNLPACRELANKIADQVLNDIISRSYPAPQFAKTSAPR